MSFESLGHPSAQKREEEGVKDTESAPEIHRYKLESGESIELTAVTFSPEHNDTKENVPKHTVVFLPGWSMAADSGPVEELGKAFAEKGNTESYAVSTHTETVPHPEEGLYREAEAVREFIRQKGLTNVVLVGHSQGGDKAIDLATMLQGEDGVIKGLVLLDSMGLYEQEPSFVAKGFAKDALLETPKTMASKLIKDPGATFRGMNAGSSVMGGIFSELRRSGRNYFERTKNEVAAMAQENSRMKEIKVPVILMSGSEDIISHPNKIIPPGEEERILEEQKERDAVAGTKTYLDPREKYLQEKIFQSSPYVRMVVPEKLGHHGVPFFRPSSVANASLYLLERFERRSQH